MNNRLDDLITVMLEIQIFSIKKGHNSGTPVTGFTKNIACTSTLWNYV